MLLDLSFQLDDFRDVVVEYPDHVTDIFRQIFDDGFNQSDPSNPGYTVNIQPCDLTWMLVRDEECLGNATVDTSNKSINIRFDQLDFKLAAVYKSALWKSRSTVRMTQPRINKYDRNIISNNKPTRLRLVEQDSVPFMRL